MVAVSGCAPSLVMKPQGVRITTPRMAAMEANVEIRERDINGMYTLKSDWTELAKKNVDQAIESIGEANGVDVFDRSAIGQAEPPYGAFVNWIERSVSEISAQRRGLIDTGRRSVTEWRFHYGGLDEWQKTLDADFVLVVLFRDAHLTTGAAVANVFSMVRVYPLQIGMACVVDLRDGRLVWCEDSVSTIGNLRLLSSAWLAVDSLLTPLLPRKATAVVAAGRR